MPLPTQDYTSPRQFITLITNLTQKVQDVETPTTQTPTYCITIEVKLLMPSPSHFSSTKFRILYITIQKAGLLTTYQADKHLHNLGASYLQLKIFPTAYSQDSVLSLLSSAYTCTTYQFR